MAAMRLLATLRCAADFPRQWRAGTSSLYPLVSAIRCPISSFPDLSITTSSFTTSCHSSQRKYDSGSWDSYVVDLEHDSKKARKQHELDVEDDGEFMRPSFVNWTKELANTVSLIGIIKGDVEKKSTSNGKSYTRCSLSVWKSSKEPPNRFNLVFWDEISEIAARYLNEGDKIHVTGRINIDTFTDKSNVVQTYVKVFVNNVHFVEPAKSDGFIEDFADKSDEETDSQALSLETASEKGQDAESQETSQFNSAGFQTGSRKPWDSKATSYEDRNLEIAKLWQAFFSDPSAWWDNRGKKKTVKSPDFKHRTTNDALWVDSKGTPNWVAQKLSKLDSQRS